jgi:hypothetical protein
MIIWGLVRAFDERWLLGEQSHSGSIGVQVAGLALALAGVVILWRSQFGRHQRARLVATHGDTAS